MPERAVSAVLEGHTVDSEKLNLKPLSDGTQISPGDFIFK